MKIIIITLILFGIQLTTLAQSAVNDALIQKINNSYKVKEASYRNVLAISNKARLNPLNYIAAGLLYAYQSVFSKQISAECNFETSCSEYTKKCIAKHGFIKGAFLGIHQLSCCSETVQQDLPKHRINKKGKIINEID